MPRKASKEPTDAELRILNCLWDAGAMRLSEIAAELSGGAGASLANTTIATTLKVMSQKGLVRRTKRGANVVWVASVTRESASRGSVDRLLDRLFDGSASKLVAHLISGGRLSESDRREVEQLLDEAETTKRSNPRKLPK
jgi:predicted transcriptional regulator